MPISELARVPKSFFSPMNLLLLQLKYACAGSPEADEKQCGAINAKTIPAGSPNLSCTQKYFKPDILFLECMRLSYV